MLNYKTVNLITLIVFMGLLVVFLIKPISYWWFILLGFIWFLFTALGSGLVGWSYHLKILNANSAVKNNYVSITFDDGPHPEHTPEVLSLLKQHGAKGTFFCVGEQINKHPDLFKQIIAEGHTVGNHTYSHAHNFGFFKTIKVHEELTKTNETIKSVSGLNPKLYRPAFGVTNPRIRKAVSKLHLKTIGWSKRSLDTTNLPDTAILKRITKNLKAGDVILLHDTSAKSVRVLEQLLLFLHEQNFESVTVDSLFNIKAYA